MTEVIKITTLVPTINLKVYPSWKFCKVWGAQNVIKVNNSVILGQCLAVTFGLKQFDSSFYWHFTHRSTVKSAPLVRLVLCTMLKVFGMREAKQLESLELHFTINSCNSDHRIQGIYKVCIDIYKERTSSTFGCQYTVPQD